MQSHSLVVPETIILPGEFGNTCCMNRGRGWKSPFGRTAGTFFVLTVRANVDAIIPVNVGYQGEYQIRRHRSVHLPDPGVNISVVLFFDRNSNLVFGQLVLSSPVESCGKLPAAW